MTDYGAITDDAVGGEQLPVTDPKLQYMTNGVEIVQLHVPLVEQNHEMELPRQLLQGRDRQAQPQLSWHLTPQLFQRCILTNKDMLHLKPRCVNLRYPSHLFSTISS